MLASVETFSLQKSHGGALLALPPPKLTLIADELLRIAVSHGDIHRDLYAITILALNARATYRLETLERGSWLARLMEWSPT